MSISFTEILLILAAAQGLFLTIFILQKYAKVYAARFVGLLIFLYSLSLLFMIVNDLGYAVKMEELYMAFLAIPFVIGPLHYFFALYLIRPRQRLRVSDFLHFLPSLFVLIGLPTFACLSPQPFAANADALGGTVPKYFIFFNWTIYIHAVTYSIVSLRKLRQHARKIKDVFSSVEKVQLNWLLNVTYLVLVVTTVFGIENLLMSFGINATNYYTASSVMVAVYVYTLGYMGLLRMDVFLDPRVSVSIQNVPTLKSAEGRQKYQKSGLSPEKAKAYLDFIVTVMESKKPFHDNGLTLNQLAEMVDMTPHNLSEVLNTQLGQNFFDFINSYRVEEVKAALVEPDKQHLTLLAIAFDAGFNSKTAFNTIFKKYTGKTPSEYRRETA